LNQRTNRNPVLLIKAAMVTSSYHSAHTRILVAHDEAEVHGYPPLLGKVSQAELATAPKTSRYFAL
jgi:hypothetical protein